MLSCSVWFCAPSFGMGGGLESRCVGRVRSADVATCRAKNTLIKLPCCIELAFQIISWGRCAVKQPSCHILSTFTNHCRCLDLHSECLHLPLTHNIPNLILYLHRALNKVTQSANQHMHTFNFFYLLKLIYSFLKHSYMFRSFDHHQAVFSSLLKSL